MARGKAMSEQAMKIRYTRAMKEQDLKKRLSMLEEIALAICWHGSIWQQAYEAANALRNDGVTTYGDDYLCRMMEAK